MFDVQWLMGLVCGSAMKRGVCLCISCGRGDKMLQVLSVGENVGGDG